MPGDHHPKYKSCVTKVKSKGDDVNPYAVCHASTGEITEQKYKHTGKHTDIFNAVKRENPGMSDESAWKIANSQIHKYGLEEQTIEELLEADYPWGQCQADQKKAGHDKDFADKICGSIKAKYGNETIEESTMRQIMETQV